MSKSARWYYPSVLPMRVQGRSTVEDNFSSEKRSLLAIFVREAIQNPLDARKANASGPVEVRFRLVSGKELDASYLNQLVDGEFIKRFNASSTAAQAFTRPSEPSVLLVEDFNTSGLEGTYNNPNVDGSKQNWNAFWFREGEGAKAQAGSNGRAGQGKITYYRMSGVRAVYGFTVRASDGLGLLMGRGSFRRNYEHNNKKFERDAYWCLNEQATPERRPEELEKFRNKLAISRTNESGLTIAIPYPVGFSDAEAIRTVITDFYFPIARGRLTIKIGTVEISKSNVVEMADNYLTDEKAHELESSFTKGFRVFIDAAIQQIDAGTPTIVAKPNWHSGSMLGDSHFAEGAVQIMRESLAKGEIVGVRFPVTVRPVGTAPASAHVDVYIQLPDNLASAEEAYIRQDLLIGQETYLAKSPHLPAARGLTFISDPSLSALMADAEEPTHMKWNASRTRVAEDYDNGKEAVAAVRHAMPRLLGLLADVAARRDTKALADFFGEPAEESATKKTKSDTGTGKGTTTGGAKPPPAQPKPFKWEHGNTWDRVHASAFVGQAQAALPFDAVVELAYQGLDDDAFAAYDPFDFDLSDSKQYPIQTSGCTIKSRTGNKVTLTVESAPFSVKVDGFDPNIRRRMRIDYNLKNNNATDLVDE